MTTATVEGAGVELAYDERGDGPPVVLVHGTASTRTIWDEVLAALGDGFRAIRYDRRAYGESGAPEGYRRTTIAEHGDDLIAVLRELDAAPALLCGHSFGAIACLDVLVREPGLVRGAALAEPPMLWLASGGAEAMSELRSEIEKGARERGSSGAVLAFVRVVCGPAAGEIVGRERGLESLRYPVGFAADVGAVGDSSFAPRDLRAIATPVVLFAGTRTPRAYREPAEVLAGMIPGAELREVESAHLIPNEAPGAVADALRELAAQP